MEDVEDILEGQTKAVKCIDCLFTERHVFP
jgi:hypothetical protein